MAEQHPPSFAETLYRVLPRLYRTRDSSGDLAAYLQGCGELLDAVCATLRQRYADNYPDNPPDGAAIEPCQDWLLPYFAELVDARLLSPLPAGRRDELGHAIRWRQGKGTLATVDSIVEAIGQTQAVVHEGWQRVATTPRIGAPLRTAVSFGYPQEPLAGNPSSMARHPDLPAATVDLRCPSRALATDENNPGAQSVAIDGQPLIWRQGSWHGAPCFPGSYEDVSRRTADIRTPDWRVGHAHPRRVLIHLPPPPGFFPPEQPVVAWNAVPKPDYLDLVEVSEPAPGVILHRARSLGTRSVLPVRVTGNVNLDSAGTPTLWRFEGIAFEKAVRATAARISLSRCAADSVRTDLADIAQPVIDAADCLFRELRASNGLVRLVGVTVLGRTIARQIQASEGLFNGRIVRDVGAGQGPPDEGCLRFSAIRRDQPAGAVRLHAVTREAPIFYSPDYGDRAAGVLTPATHRAILSGAEDEGEIGAFHHAMHARIHAAIVAKLAEFLPAGLEAVLIPDPRLTEPPYEFA